MDTKWRRFSHTTLTKIIIFLIAIACFSGVITILFNTLIAGHRVDWSHLAEKSFYLSNDYINDCNNIIYNLRTITNDYKNEANIVNGGTVTADEINSETDALFYDFTGNSSYFNPNLDKAENYKIFQNIYADRLSQIKTG